MQFWHFEVLTVLQTSLYNDAVWDIDLQAKLEAILSGIYLVARNPH